MKRIVRIVFGTGVMALGVYLVGVGAFEVWRGHFIWFAMIVLSAQIIIAGYAIATDYSIKKLIHTLRETFWA